MDTVSTGSGTFHSEGRQSGHLPVLTIIHTPAEALARAQMHELRGWAERLDIAIRRERAKSTMRHWSYDLNRHIALKRARDRVYAAMKQRSATSRRGN